MVRMNLQLARQSAQRQKVTNEVLAPAAQKALSDGISPEDISNLRELFYEGKGATLGAGHLYAQRLADSDDATPHQRALGHALSHRPNRQIDRFDLFNRTLSELLTGDE